MNLLLLLLAVGSPSPVNAAPVGAWIHFIWVIVVVALIIFVIYWAWTKIGPLIMEPVRTIIMVLGIILIAICIIYFILIPMMGVF